MEAALKKAFGEAAPEGESGFQIPCSQGIWRAAILSSAPKTAAIPV
jgi:hypothetical protein